MLSIPVALIGGVASTWFAGGIVTIAVAIRFIALLGIATRKGPWFPGPIRFGANRP